MLSVVAKVLKTVTGGGKVVTQTVGQAAASTVANGLNTGTRAALLEATNITIKAAAQGAKGAGAAASSGLVNGLNIGTQVALQESVQGTLRATTHATKQGIRELGDIATDVAGEIPKGIINAAGLGGIASSGVGITVQQTAKAAAKEISSLKVPAPVVGAVAVPVQEAIKKAAVETAEVAAELANTSYEGVVLKGGLSAAKKVGAGIIGGGG